MPLTLTAKNIRPEIATYLIEVASTEIPVFSKEPLAFFSELKRGHIRGGRYPGHSPLEVANRVLSDLVVFATAEHLLREPFPGQDDPMESISVQLGTENSEPYDLMGRFPKGQRLCGEAFNVSPSFFTTKLNKTRAKLREAPPRAIKLIAFNSDGPDPDWKPKLTWLTHWALDVDQLVEAHGGAVRTKAV